ncbi:hypothetical protein ACQW5G_07025 [Fructilactobacillus sp. Tb1]|uniref:hypothetical protein n=1 Tax=Fructilactobacillus sp. Tb1 TaxID=3422304 RepID=UPI003D283DD7
MELEQSQLSILLNANDMANIRSQVYLMMKSAITKVEQDAGLSSPWIRGKAKCRKYLDGISQSKFDELNIPSHDVRGVTCYNKEEVDRYIKDNF